MRAKLVIEGREFPIDINDPELQKLLAQKPKHTGYERVEHNQKYYYIAGDGDAVESRESGVYADGDAYRAANYYSDETIAENNARADKLMRQLRRFAVEHRENALDWNNAAYIKYYIDYNHGRKRFDIFSNEIYQNFGTLYFDSQKTAQLAIDTFHNELIWYFTEYKDSL